MHAEQAYFFSHALLRDAAYQLQLPSVRARLHRLVVEILESLAASFEAGWSAYNGEIAEHARAAQDGEPDVGVVADLSRKEVQYAFWAGLRAKERHDHLTALHWFQFGALARAALPGDRAQCLVHGAHSASLIGKRAVCMELATRAVQETANDVQATAAQRLTADLSLALARRVNEMFAACAQSYQACLEAAQREGLEDKVTECLSGLASCRLIEGDYEGASDLLRQAIEGDRKSGNIRKLAGNLANLAAIHSDLGRYEEALSICREAEALAMEQGLDGMRMELQGMMGSIHMSMGHHDQARDLLVGAVRWAERQGNMYGLTVRLISLGNLESALGNAVEARSHLRRAEAIARECGYQRALAYALNNRADVDLGAGLFEEAMHLSREAGALLAAVRVPMDYLWAESLFVKAALAARQQGEALKAVERAHQNCTAMPQALRPSSPMWAMQVAVASAAATDVIAWGRGEGMARVLAALKTLEELRSEHTAVASGIGATDPLWPQVLALRETAISGEPPAYVCGIDAAPLSLEMRREMVRRMEAEDARAVAEHKRRWPGWWQRFLATASPAG